MHNLNDRIRELQQFRRETGSFGTPPQELERYRDLANWVSEMRNRAITGDLNLQMIAMLKLLNVKPERRALTRMRSNIINRERLDFKLKHLSQALQPLAGQRISVELTTLLKPATCRFIERCVNVEDNRESLSSYIESWRPLDLLIQGRHLEDLVALALANTRTPNYDQDNEDISEQPKSWKTVPLSDVMSNVARARANWEFALYFENIGFVLLRKIIHSGQQALFQSVSGEDWVFQNFESMEINNVYVYAAVANNKRLCILYFIRKSELLPENLTTSLTIQKP